jgi:murein L,D-transpeptidase YafK
MYAYQRPVTDAVDVAVVLGNRVMPDGTASVDLRDRTLAAVRLYKAGLARHLYLSGAVWPVAPTGGPELSEPAAMRRVCVENGVREEDITLDPVGDNTRATAFDAARFMKDRRYSTVVVCTDQYHLFRTMKSFREMGIEARTARAWPGDWQCAGLHATLREMVANVVYWMRPEYHKARILRMTLKSAKVVVRKTAGILEVYDAGVLVKKFACITGGNIGDKAVEGDRRTPIGTFHVVFKNPESKFHLSLGLDYPGMEDAQRGLKSGLITRQEYERILEALKSDLSLVENQQKLWYTALGGEIFIHGHAEGRSGTAGCVALSNADIDEIYAALPVGTAVEIRP